MRSKVAGPIQVWGCLVLLSCTAAVHAQEETTAEAPPNNPLVVKPTTTEEKFAAVLTMLKLARPDLARYYIEQTLADHPSEELLLQLRKTHGMGTFLQLTAIEELNPPATELLDLVNQAVKSQIGNPEYADELIRRLVGTPRERLQALNELKHLGAYAVPPLLKNLTNPDGISSEVLTQTLARLGTPAVPPLVGALTSPDAEVRAVAAEVLGQLGTADDAIWLWAPAFTKDEPTGSQLAARRALARIRFGSDRHVDRITDEGAARKLLTVATAHLSGRYKWPEMYDDVEQIPVWTWSDAEGTVIEQPVGRQLASNFYAERLAREATLLSRELQQAPVVLLASLLARDVELNSWQRIPESAESSLDLAITAGPELCEQVLQYALDQQIPASALGALQALSRNGSVELLSSAAPHGAVQAALNAPHQRVQFAAAVAILHWEPTVSFRGSRRVVEILARSVNGEATSASVVVDPNRQRANETASLFTELGFRAALAPTGMEGFRIAAEQGNVAIAVLHPNVVRWELSQTIANLRADARTASIPVIIYGPAAIHGDFQRISHEYANVAYVDEASVPVDISEHLRPILAQISPPLLTEAQRADQIKEASFWLRRIAIRNVSQVFDLTPAEEALTKLLGDPQYAEDALVSLGAIGTVSVQKTLLLTATAPALDNEIRALAASQLAFHIQHYGQLVTPADLQGLKGTYEAETNADVRAALASVIGSLKPTAAAARLLLLSRPLSSSPSFEEVEQ